MRFRNQGVWERGPRYWIPDRDAIRAVAVLASAAGRTRDRAGVVVLAASSAVVRVIIVGNVMLPPPKD